MAIPQTLLMEVQPYHKILIFPEIFITKYTNTSNIIIAIKTIYAFVLEPEIEIASVFPKI